MKRIAFLSSLLAALALVSAGAAAPPSGSFTVTVDGLATGPCAVPKPSKLPGRFQGTSYCEFRGTVSTSFGSASAVGRIELRTTRSATAASGTLALDFGAAGKTTVNLLSATASASPPIYSVESPPGTWRLSGGRGDWARTRGTGTYLLALTFSERVAISIQGTVSSAPGRTGPKY